MAQAQAKSSELYGIQMLRALAALAVVFHHALEESNGAAGRFSPDWLTTSGASGVDIFFVISGFIMLYVSFRKNAPPTAGNFLFRRATRIYPFYWLCCLFILFISAVGFLSSHHYSPLNIVESFLLFPGSNLIGVSWTLVYEIYFYLLFAATLGFRSAKIAIGATTAAILVLCVLSAKLPSGDVMEFLAAPIPIEFCFGLGLAYAYMKYARNWNVSLFLGALGLILLTIAPVFVAHSSTSGLPGWQRVIAWGIPSALLVASVLNIGEPRNAIARFCVLLGDASYALYLTHVFVMIGYGRLIKIGAISRLPQIAVVPIIVLLAVATGLASHLLVEKPLLGLIRRITHRTPGHASPA